MPKMKTLVSLLLAAVAAPVLANGAAAPAKPDLKKGEAISQQVCAACHANDGTRGNPANPILQGQHADYLVKQLNEFKEGKRDNGIMKGMAAALSAEDMRHVAAFYASKKAPVGAAIDKALVTLGEKIYRGGIAEKAVPACAGCHSPNGAGIPAQFPRLSGQHAGYVEAQLKNFRYDAATPRKNSAQMTPIANRLSDQEIKALAAYIQGLQ